MEKYQIVFDDHCAVCSLGAKIVRETSWQKDVQMVELSHASAVCNIDPQLACDQMAVIDKSTNEIAYGVKGYAWLVGMKVPFLGKLMQIKFIHKILEPIYIFIASNRRIIAPRKVTENTCEPTLVKSQRIFLILLAAVYAIVITYIKGDLLNRYDGFEKLNGFKLLGITGVGWLLTAITYKGPKKWDYYGHLAFIAATAIFFQTIALVGYYFQPSFWWILGSMILSDGWMVYLHAKRMRLLNMESRQTLRWWLILHITAGAQIVYYLYF